MDARRAYFGITDAKLCLAGSLCLLLRGKLAIVVVNGPCRLLVELLLSKLRSDQSLEIG